MQDLQPNNACVYAFLEGQLVEETATRRWNLKSMRIPEFLLSIAPRYPVGDGTISNQYEKIWKRNRDVGSRRKMEVPNGEV